MPDKLYDLNFLRDYYGDDLESMKTILALYIEETPKDILLIEQLLENKDTLNAKAAVHKIKTNVSMLGVKNAGDFANTMHHLKTDSIITEEVMKQFEVFKHAVTSAVNQMATDVFEKR